MKYFIEKYSIGFSKSNEEANFQLAKLGTEETALKDELCRKIYIVVDEINNKYCYVGEAHTSIKKRFQRGFVSYRYAQRNGRGRNGYAGYKWIPYGIEQGSLKVFVVIFEDKSLIRDFVEAVEGELVYLIRNEVGEWPLYQNEIHFHNEETNTLTLRSKEVAGDVFINIKFE